MNDLLTLPPGPHWHHLGLLAVATLIGAVLTRAVISIAPKLDFVSRPSGERLSYAPTPMGGGVAIFLTLALGLGLLSWDLLVATSLIFLLGLIDDRRNLSPKIKLVVQFVAAGWMVASPIDPGPAAVIMSGPEWIAFPVTVCWYVGMANSVNLLDNMDGSAAGVAAVAAGFLYALSIGAGGSAASAPVAAAAAVAVGAALGFLVFNFPPAKVFMGDAGSLVLGFALAGLAAHLPSGDASPIRQLLMAAFVLGIPLFDTILVWVSRRAADRPFLQGGRDHTTHRLLALGLSPRRAVLALYGVAAALGGAGIAVAGGDLGTAVMTVIAGGITLVLLGVFLGDVTVYRTAEGQARISTPRSPALLYGVELIVDVALISAAWLGAYALRFAGVQLPEGGAALPFYLAASALPALPFVVAFKVSCLLVFNLYRGFWRTIHLRDVSRIVQASALATLLIVVTATVANRFENYSRGVIMIDFLLTLLAVVGSRSALRVLRETLARLIGRRQRAVLIGDPVLRPLLERSLGTDGPYELVGVSDADTPEELLAAAQGFEAEVALLGVDWPADDPRLTTLLGAGILVRHLSLTLD